MASRLDQTEGRFGGALEKVSKAVLEVRGHVAELLEKPTEKDTPPKPWADRATQAQWDELVDWLQRSYEVLAEFKIYPCWPAHLGMVEEIAGLHHSWERAVVTDELATTTGSSDLTAWHDRWLWPLLQRAKGGHYRTATLEPAAEDPGNARLLAAAALRDAIERARSRCHAGDSFLEGIR